MLQLLREALFPSGSVSEENLPEQLFLSHTLSHVSSKTTDLASKLPPGTVNYEHVAFLKHFAKKSQNQGPKEDPKLVDCIR